MRATSSSVSPTSTQHQIQTTPLAQSHDPQVEEVVRIYQEFMTKMQQLRDEEQHLVQDMIQRIDKTKISIVRKRMEKQLRLWDRLTRT